MVSEKLKSNILDRMKNEYEAHFYYSNAANWCENTGYLKAAAYYRDEAKSELEHAQKLKDFLNNWGIFFEIPAIDFTISFESLYEIIEGAFKIELDLYEKYSKDISMECMSYFALMQEMIAIQYNSQAECRTQIDRMKLFDNNKTSISLYEQSTF